MPGLNGCDRPLAVTDGDCLHVTGLLGVLFVSALFEGATLDGGVGRFVATFQA